ncbi:hypothetical protein PJ267_13940 [Arthrobacter sp. OVS8]|nr:hypothetical protein PJ267_13940 [Arthrobacter sp. OVS8]
MADRPDGHPFALLDGETLAIGAPQSGFRSYLAVRGGVDTAPVLGSRSTDTMSGIGPAPLAAGQLLAAGGKPSPASWDTPNSSRTSRTPASPCSTSSPAPAPTGSMPGHWHPSAARTGK